MKRKICLFAKRGFTLIELLIVIAITGILVSAIMLGLGEAQKKAQRSSFKNETSSAISGFSIACLSGPLAQPSDTKYTSWESFTINNCGIGSSSGKFLITAISKNDSIDCTAIINENGVRYVGTWCN